MSSVWVVDADGIESENDGIKNVLKTMKVKAFLEDEKKLGIAAARGLGKTFLLKVKRNQFQRKSGVICIPSNSMVDVVYSPKFNSANSNFYNNYNNWCHLWEVALAASIINELRLGKYSIRVDLKNINKHPAINELLELKYTRPSGYFSYILAHPKSYANVLFQAKNILIDVLKEIHNSVAVFIDKVDQSFAEHTYHILGQTNGATGPRNASYWQYAQLALLETSYAFLALNPHIKIYFSIRKEALVDASCMSYVFQNAMGYIVKLDYSKDELKNMFIQYIQYEASENLVFPSEQYSNPTKAFLGIDTIQSKYVNNAVEDIFDYIYRHTFMRPRDIMDICYNIYLADMKRVTDRPEEIRKIVNTESKIIFENLLSEADNTFSSFDREHINELCQLINYNILNCDMLSEICYNFNEKIRQRYENDYSELSCKCECSNCQKLHPFCHLYSMGLLGAKWVSRNDDISIRFNPNNETMIGDNRANLPSSDLYFLHPCFASHTEHIRKNSNKVFDFDKNIIVGEGQIIESSKCEEIKLAVSRKSNNIFTEKVFISSTCYDLQEEREMIDDMLSNLGFDVVRSDGDRFNTNLNGVHSHDHCIDELLKCKYVIFIIGKRYGGIYSGEKYQSYAREIGETDRMLSSPSISLMEYYVARQNQIETHVFVDSSVYDERLTYKNNIKYNPEFYPAHVDDNRTFHIIDYVTKQKVNNWFRQYNKMQHLSELIRIVFENKAPVPQKPINKIK